jgi:20S proteasome subunit alpha 2
MTPFFLSFVASNGVVLATENKHKSILYDEHSVHKVEMITKHIGMIYSGEYRIWN